MSLSIARKQQTQSMKLLFKEGSDDNDPIEVVDIQRPKKRTISQVAKLRFIFKDNKIQFVEGTNGRQTKKIMLNTHFYNPYNEFSFFDLPPHIPTNEPTHNETGPVESLTDSYANRVHWIVDMCFQSELRSENLYFSISVHWDKDGPFVVVSRKYTDYEWVKLQNDAKLTFRDLEPKEGKIEEWET